MTTFTGFFKSSAIDGVYIGALKGEGFEVVLETRTPDAAEACLRGAFPVTKTAPVVTPDSSDDLIGDETAKD